VTLTLWPIRKSSACFSPLSTRSGMRLPAFNRLLVVCILFVPFLPAEYGLVIPTPDPWVIMRCIPVERANQNWALDVVEE
jgi:hypothetical protein